MRELYLDIIDESDTSNMGEAMVVSGFSSQALEGRKQKSNNMRK